MARTLLDKPYVGKVIVVAAPSGSGKTTLVRHLLSEISFLDFSTSATSRRRRPYEQEGKDYYFLTVKAFKSRIEKAHFVEWEEVYENQFYGTLLEEVERLWDEAKAIVFDVDVKGAISLKEEFQEGALTIFVKPPSLDALETRLKNRGTEPPESIKKRITKASEEMEFLPQFDTVVVNDDLAEAKEAIKKVALEFLE